MSLNRTWHFFAVLFLAILEAARELFPEYTALPPACAAMREGRVPVGGAMRGLFEGIGRSVGGVIGGGASGVVQGLPGGIAGGAATGALVGTATGRVTLPIHFRWTCMIAE